MTYDIAFAWINIIACAAAVCVAVTWAPAAMQIFHHRNRIIFVATAVMGLTGGMAVARGVSFAIRTFNMTALEPMLIIGVSIEGASCIFLAAAYFVKLPPRESTSASFRGIYAGGAVFILLAALWVFYRH